MDEMGERAKLKKSIRLNGMTCRLGVHCDGNSVWGMEMCVLVQTHTYDSLGLCESECKCREGGAESSSLRLNPQHLVRGEEINKHL